MTPLQSAACREGYVCAYFFSWTSGMACGDVALQYFKKKKQIPDSQTHIFYKNVGKNSRDLSSFSFF